MHIYIYTNTHTLNPERHEQVYPHPKPYIGTTRKIPLLGPYSRTMSRTMRWLQGGGVSDERGSLLTQIPKINPERQNTQHGQPLSPTLHARAGQLPPRPLHTPQPSVSEREFIDHKTSMAAC